MTTEHDDLDTRKALLKEEHDLSMRDWREKHDTEKQEQEEKRDRRNKAWNDSLLGVTEIIYTIVAVLVIGGVILLILLGLDSC